MSVTWNREHPGPISPRPVGWGPRVVFGLALLAGVYLLAAGLYGLVFPTSAADQPARVCQDAAEALDEVGLSGVDLTIPLHVIGCNESTSGAVWTPVERGCGRTAWILWQQGFKSEQIVSVVTGDGSCIIHEDGSYGPAS